MSLELYAPGSCILDFGPLVTPDLTLPRRFQAYFLEPEAVFVDPRRGIPVITRSSLTGTEVGTNAKEWTLKGINFRQRVGCRFVQSGQFPKHDVEHVSFDEADISASVESCASIPFTTDIPKNSYKRYSETLPNGDTIEVSYGWWVKDTPERLDDNGFSTLSSRRFKFELCPPVVCEVYCWNTRHPERYHLWEALVVFDPVLGSFLIQEKSQPNWYPPISWGDADLTVTTRSVPADYVCLHADGQRIASLCAVLGANVERALSKELIGFEETLPEKFDEALSNYLGPNMSWLEFLTSANDIPESFKALGIIPRTVKDLSGYFLNYLYGVKTLPGDFDDIIESFCSIFRRTFSRYYEHLKARGTEQREMSTIQWNCSCLGRPASQAAIIAAGFGLTDPLTEIWNCIPYSFVIDWFTNLGDTLARFENRAMWKSLELDEIVWSATIRLDLSKVQTSSSFGHVVARGYARMYVRYYLADLPAVRWYLAPDVMSNSRRHWAELSALLVQQLK